VRGLPCNYLRRRRYNRAMARTSAATKSTPAPSRLREERERAGYTQLRAAVLLGVSAGWYRTVEREPSFLSDALAGRAAELFGVPAEELQS
jgi:DNA-binding XRE family transcriptional regulator